MLILLLFSTLFQFVHCSCPDGFDLVRDGECRGLYYTADIHYDVSLNTVITKCKEIQAQPVIIHDDEQQSYWTSLSTHMNGLNPVLTIGLTCNLNTKKWMWADGSPMDYKPDLYNPDLDKECYDGGNWNLWASGYWSNDRGDTSLYTTNVFCTTQLHQPVPSDDGCDGFEDDSDDGVCYQIGSTVENWNDAQKACRNFGAYLASIHSQKENSFIRRLAVSRGAVNGLYLGGTSSGKGNDFGWIDGTDWDYQNFYSGFPIAGVGSCLAMDTAGSTAGEWVNLDCSSTLSVACVRQPRNHVCTSGPWQEGQNIVSPGFPFEASIPCDYMFSVAAGKRVEVEIAFLEANSCCDHLVLYENVIGENVIANLTGEISDKVYKTKSSNFMRVSWNPNGGNNVKGIMITFRAV